MSGPGVLRVGLLHFTAPPIVGGVESIIRHQAAALAVRGHHVVVLAGRGRTFRRDVEFRQIPALDSKYPPLVALNAALQQGHVPTSFESLSREVEKALGAALDELDVIVIHNALTLHFNLPLTAAVHRMASASMGPALVAWCHDLSWANPLYADLVYQAYPWNLLKTRIEHATYVVLSEDRRHDLARLAGIEPNKIWIIPAGVEVGEKLALGRATRTLLAEFGLLEADPFILLPARITRRKNIECAIRVTDALRKLGLRPRLLVTGPRGPHDPASIRYVRELQGLIQDLALTHEVFLLQAPVTDRKAWKPGDAMMDDLYRAADLMLFPSSQEGFGIPLLEAGVAGLPVFCSDIPAFREIGRREVHYFSLNDSPCEIAARVATFLQRDERYRLRKRVARDFGSDAMVDRQLIPLLRRAVGDQ